MGLTWVAHDATKGMAQRLVENRALTIAQVRGMVWTTIARGAMRGMELRLVEDRLLTIAHILEVVWTAIAHGARGETDHWLLEVAAHLGAMT